MKLFVFESGNLQTNSSVEALPNQDFIEVDICKETFEEITSKIKTLQKKFVLVSCSGEIYTNELKLNRLIRWAKKNDVVLQVKDVPLCYLQDFPWLSYDLKLKLLFEEGLIKLKNPERIIKKKFLACDSCAVRSFCPGADLRFENQVYPIFKPKDEILIKAKRGFGLKEKVAVFGKFKDYNDFESILKAVKKGFDSFGGVEKLVPKGSKVLIKPNLAEPLPPEKVATTHPVVIKAIVRVLKQVTNEIYISDLAAGTNYQAFDRLMTVTGMKDVALSENVKIVDMSKDGYTVKRIPNYYLVEKTDFLSFLDKVDLIINVPKMKTHGLTFFTCCVKSCFGLIHPDERKYIHSFVDRFNFAKGVVDVYSRLKDKFALHVVDGIIGMEGDEGPSYGDPVNVGLLFFGKDGVAVDTVVSKVMGYEPEHLPTVKFATEKYLGEGYTDNIQIVGDFKDVVEIIHPNFKKHSLFNLLNPIKNEAEFGKAYIYKVSIDQHKCTLCKTCFNSCPVGAIVFDEIGKRLKVIEDKCIHCYTCHEVCPYGAIKLTKSPNFQKNI
ncbi:MAG: hypothetical protein PWR32_54 [Candidatus Woesearchaeota archaeon]|nr:hypothetical protein [Candidatus Woesearchaeota archaeon]